MVLRVSDEEVDEAVGGHNQQLELELPEYREFEAAYEGKFWQQRRHPWAKYAATDPEMPVLLEVMQMSGFLSTYTSNLYLHAPRTEATPPSVFTSRVGRPRSLEGAPEQVQAIGDELLLRADVQELVTNAYLQALMYSKSAIKLGYDSPMKGDRRSPLDRVWMSSIPSWELLWDDRAATPMSQTYRGHLRWERADRAELICGAPLPEGTELHNLPDIVESEGPQLEARLPEDGGRLKKYVQILEFYDLLAMEQRFYLVPAGKNPHCVQLGESMPIPYTLPNGMPGIPIEPVVLVNNPRYPMRGLPACRRVYQQQAETNLLMSIVANGLRRDSARYMAFLKDKVSKEFLEALASGKDMRWIPIEGQTLDGIWKAMEWPDFARTLDRYKAWLEDFRKSAQGFGDLMSGKQGQYLSATEAELLAGAGEMATVEIASRMVRALGRTVELGVTILSAHAGSDLVVARNGKLVKVRKDVLDLPWSIRVLDAASTPVREERRKKEWGEALGILAPLVQRAAMKPRPAVPSAPAAPGAPAAPPAPAITPVEIRFAQLAVTHTVQIYGLPSSMTWEQLSVAAPAEPEAPPQISEVEAVQTLRGLLPGPAAGAEGGV